MKRKYDIENFYVGELYLSHKIGNLVYPDEHIEINKKAYILSNGAIDFQKDLFKKYIDYESKRQYDGVLTIFYKSSNKCMCLHDIKIYGEEELDFYENLVPLTELLPKFSYNTPQKISIIDALLMFDYLFKKNNKLINKYNRTLYNINDLYLGNLNLYSSFNPENSDKRITYYNLAERYILYNDDTSTRSFFGVSDVVNDSDYLTGIHEYEIFHCLFLNLHNDKMYNINNFQIYETGVSQNQHFDLQKIGESYYDWMTPLRKILQENNIKYNSELINIPNALKLSKKLNN